MFLGEPWTLNTWSEWCDTLLFLQWEGACRGSMPDEYYEWDSFRAEWFRALFECGKEAGFVMYEKR